VVVFATQSVSDVLAKPITAAIMESCLTKIFLPNPEARSQIASAAYTQIGLSSRQIEILSYAIPKQHYYYTSPAGQRLFNLGIGPVAMSFVGAGGKDDLKAIRMLQYFYGSDWPAEWLWQRGQREAAAHWLGGPAKHAAAMRVLTDHRQTWPAEWMRLAGSPLDAERWMKTYLLQSRKIDELQRPTIAAAG
jgi:hypothetical protein